MKLIVRHFGLLSEQDLSWMTHESSLQYAKQMSQKYKEAKDLKAVDELGELKYNMV